MEFIILQPASQGIHMSTLKLSFDHIGLFANDLAKMEDFYTRVLEFTVTDRGQLQRQDSEEFLDLLFLSRNPDQHHQIVLVSGRPVDLSFNVVNQVSLRAADLMTLRELHRRIRAYGSDEIRPISHGNALSIYVRDPNGNKIELFMDLPWYVSQPLRDEVDMDVSDEELMAALERHARELPGFRMRGEWRDEMAKKMAAQS
ncbi:VOC family protein [Hydrogenophaga sp.]|uniref:VOC family protein n=1 Tax=Hydrogenophaga sp. TaxID=1904254 RepID=UPI003525172C